MHTNKVTNLIEPIKNKTKEYFHFITISVCIIMALLGINFGFNLVTRLSSIEAERAVIQSQISALVLTMDDRERLLALDRALMQIPAVKDNMSEAVPEITKKLLDTQNRYYSLGLRTNRILAVIEVESGFVPTALSKTKSGKALANGLMQIVPTTAKSLLLPMGMTWSPGLMNNPVLSIELGSQLLASIHSNMIERGYETTDSFNITHAIYYSGERSVMSHFLDTGTLPTEARDYVVKINMAQKRWAAKGL